VIDVERRAAIVRVVDSDAEEFVVRDMRLEDLHSLSTDEEHRIAVLEQLADVVLAIIIARDVEILDPFGEMTHPHLRFLTEIGDRLTEIGAVVGEEIANIDLVGMDLLCKNWSDGLHNEGDDRGFRRRLQLIC
jgi:hypothetical protein